MILLFKKLTGICSTEPGDKAVSVIRSQATTGNGFVYSPIISHAKRNCDC